MDVTELAAVAYLLATAVAVGFQVALALGAPWGAYAMGGRYPGKLPPVMRLSAALQGVLLAVLALVVLSAAGLVAPSLDAEFPSLIWVPIGAVLLVSSLIVATAGAPAAG